MKRGEMLTTRREQFYNNDEVTLVLYLGFKTKKKTNKQTIYSFIGSKKRKLFISSNKMNERCNTRRVSISEKLWAYHRTCMACFIFIIIDYRIKLPGGGGRQTGSREQYCTVCHNKPLRTTPTKKASFR